MVCNEYQVSFYKYLIGVLRCIIELVHIDIAFEVSYLSRHLVFLRTEQLVQALYIFNYLEIKYSNDLSLYPCYKLFTCDKYVKSKVQAVKDLYLDYGEEILPNAPKPRLKPVQVNCFVSSDDEGDRAI